MPGNIFVTDNAIIIENPLSGNEFYHVFDKENHFKKKNVIALCNNIDTVCTFGILPIEYDYVNTHLVNI